MRTLRFLQFFFRRIFMSFPKKRRRAKVDGDESFLAVLRHFKPFGQLDTKIARARAQDEPVLYAHVLPGSRRAPVQRARRATALSGDGRIASAVYRMHYQRAGATARRARKRRLLV